MVIPSHQGFVHNNVVTLSNLYLQLLFIPTTTVSGSKYIMVTKDSEE